MLGFCMKNWCEVLKSLGFTEQRNPNGNKYCYDVYDNNGIPKWQYDNDDDQRDLYYFFVGINYQKLTA